MNSSALVSFVRSLSRHKLYALLNIGGLVLGIAVFLVLFLAWRFETDYDHSLPGWDKLWVMEETYTMPGYPQEPSPWVMGGELDQLRGDFPDLVGTRYNTPDVIVRRGAEATTESLATVDTNFFDLFQFPVIAGDPAATLADPDGLIITEKMAKKYLGTESPIGQTITLVIDGKPYPYRVGAVLKDMREDVTFHGDMFAQLVKERFGGQFFDHWGSSSLATILKFPNADAARAFEARLPDFLQRHAGPSGNFSDPVSKMFRQNLRPLGRFHLYTPSDQATATTLGVVGLLTLLIAIVNYVNLATARGGLRAREVALRKVLGGTRRALMIQFLAEAIATVALAALIGLAITEIALPFMNAISGSELAITYWGREGIVLPLVGMVVAVGVLAGIYPAFVLSRFRPAAVLASARSPGGGRAGARLRAGLVIVQFAIAIAFAIGTGVMLSQIAHVREADVGFRRDGLIVVRSFPDSALDPTQRSALMTAFADIPGVQSVTRANHAPGDQSNTNYGSVARPGVDGPGPSLMQLQVGPDYFATYDVHSVAGRLFDREHPGDDIRLIPEAEAKSHARSVVLNQSAVRELGFDSAESAIGQSLNGGFPWTVVGVVGDVRFKSPRDEVRPAAYFYDTGDIYASYAAVRYAGTDPQTMIDRIEAIWRRTAPGVPFAARSAEDNLYEQYYKEDAQRSNLFTVGSALAVLIGCIGLYGLASFDTARRVKEIGIRKTLGASTRDILSLLLRQFLRPVLLANLLAWPLAYFAMRHWLSEFDDRIVLSPLFFLAASVGALVIAVVTVLGQSWRVARAEPARALRYE